MILAAAGVLFALLAQYNVVDWKPKPLPSVNYYFAVLGVCCLLGAVAVYVADADIFALGGARIENTATGFRTTFRHKCISVDFGRFEKLAAQHDAVVVLPASEYFDDRCFHDRNTVAGAFLHENFDPGQIAKIAELRAGILSGFKREEAPIAEGRVSYGVGTCAYIELPFAGKVKGIVFGAATSERDGARADLAALFKVLDEVRCVIVDNRVPRAYLPLLGSGRGGLSPELSYLLILSGMLQAKAGESGGGIGDIGIIVYQPEGKPPQVSKRAAKRGLRRLIDLYRSPAA